MEKRNRDFIDSLDIKDSPVKVEGHGSMNAWSRIRQEAKRFGRAVSLVLGIGGAALGTGAAINQMNCNWNPYGVSPIPDARPLDDGSLDGTIHDGGFQDATADGGDGGSPDPDAGDGGGPDPDAETDAEVQKDAETPDAEADADIQQDAETPDAGPTCGNGTIEGTEECDSANLNGQDCTSQGFSGSGLQCHTNCTFDLSQCTQSSTTCGNDIVEAGEQCDNANLFFQTCNTLGYDGGSLSCASNCTFDTSQCTRN